MSGPHLILEEQVVKLLPPVLGSLSPSLHLEVLRVRLVAIVTGELVALVVVSSSSRGRNQPILIPKVNITSTRTDVAASVVSLDGS